MITGIISVATLVLVAWMVWEIAAYMRTYNRWERDNTRLNRLKGQLQSAEEHSRPIGITERSQATLTRQAA